MQDRIHQQTNAQDKIQHQQTVGQHNIHAQTKEQDNTKHQHKYKITYNTNKQEV